MSQENVEIIARLYDEFISRPDKALGPEVMAFFDPAIEVQQSAAILGTEGNFHGYTGLAAAVGEVLAVFEDPLFVRRKLIDAGDRIVAIADFHARGRESGVDVNARIAHVWTLRDGRIVTWQVYMDPAEALEAVGLSE